MTATRNSVRYAELVLQSEQQYDSDKQQYTVCRASTAVRTTI